MSEYFGNPSVLISQDWEYSPSPTGGDVIIQRHTGSPGAMLSLMNSYRIAGYQCRHTVSEGRVEVTVVLPLFQTGQTAETPSDVYEINTDFVQEKLWGCQFIVAAATAVSPSDPESRIALWRDSIESSLVGSNNGGPQTLEEAGFQGILASIYRLFLLGSDSYEVQRPVLTRLRTVSIQYSGQLVLDATPKVYSTARLGQAPFFIPPGIISRLPGGVAGNPVPSTKPTETEWAWKLRRDERHIEMNGKVQEVKDWVFAAWSTITHTYIA